MKEEAKKKEKILNNLSEQVQAAVAKTETKKEELRMKKEALRKVQKDLAVALALQDAEAKRLKVRITLFPFLYFL